MGNQTSMLEVFVSLKLEKNSVKNTVHALSVRDLEEQRSGNALRIEVFAQYILK